MFKIKSMNVMIPLDVNEFVKEVKNYGINPLHFFNRSSYVQRPNTTLIKRNGHIFEIYNSPNIYANSINENGDIIIDYNNTDHYNISINIKQLIAKYEPFSVHKYTLARLTSNTIWFLKKHLDEFLINILCHEFDNNINYTGMDNNVDDLSDALDSMYIDDSESKPIKYKKKPIPSGMKEEIWDYWIGADIGSALCLCCKKKQIKQIRFVAGHIKAEVEGGEMSVTNIVPICSSCNLSMKTKNMIEYMKTYNYGELPIPKGVSTELKGVSTELKGVSTEHKGVSTELKGVSTESKDQKNKTSK